MKMNRTATRASWTAEASQARRRFGMSFALAMLALASFGFSAEVQRSSEYDYEPPAPGSYVLPVVKEAADGEVLDTEGRPLRLRELTRGRVTVMSFIYTRCAAAKACPYATGVLRELHQL